jgi:UDP-2,4-diacetamido-2,4,6-trideoxy-beta-L-altropyranose hydrolase
VKIVFRADASQRLGAGHVMRCLTLAEAARAHGASCRFISRGMPASLLELLLSRGIGVDAISGGGEVSSEAEDASQSAAVLAGEGTDWLVVDHYGLGMGWECAMRHRARYVMALDDLAREHDCDLVLDQNFYTDLDTRYLVRVPPRTRTLLGPRYALLREEFRLAHARARARSGEVRRLLVFFGGMDAANCTSAALDALVRLRKRNLAVDVVIGAEHAHRESIAAVCAANRFELHVQTSRMAELMLAADLAVGAGGSSSWERCSVGLPALLVVVAENQRQLVADGEAAGFACAPVAESPDADFFTEHLRRLLDDAPTLSRLSQRGLDLVDGRGVFRVLRAMGMTPVSIRAADAADSRNIFDWRNHPDIRRVSRSDLPIEWPVHDTWFRSVLADPDRLLLIGEHGGQPAGVVRFDIEGDSADVSIYKVPEQAAAVSGGDLLAAAEFWLLQQRPQVRQLTAAVLEGNDASRRLFLAAGYSADAQRFSKRIHE